IRCGVLGIYFISLDATASNFTMTQVIISYFPQGKYFIKIKCNESVVVIHTKKTAVTERLLLFLFCDQSRSALGILTEARPADDEAR
ncbi:MAG: hypothetical protein IIX36_05870, partial [Clostridia bacterium]|nr:hypothetical protein [Clostridia bacterium]